MPGFALIWFLIILPRAADQTMVAGTEHIPKSRLELVCKLSPEISESSGLMYWNHKFWTFNDSGGGPVLYGFSPDSAGILETITVSNEKNTDWEEVTQDKEFIYIGDFGNNLGNRHDLKIYKIRKADVPLGAKHTSVIAAEISFSFADQKNFRPALWHARYDCEAMIPWGDSLIVFTKDWDRETSHFYFVPKQPGNYNLSPAGMFPARGLVTGAAFDPDHHLLVLCGYDEYVPFIWYIFPKSPSDISKAKRYRYTYWKMAGVQTEGICFGPDSAIYISSERSRFVQAMYRITDRNLPGPEK